MRQTLSAAGFDLACGFLYADRRRRDALVYDLMELARPTVDDRVLAFLQATTFHAGDFTRVSDDSCQLQMQVARAVVTGGAPQRRLEEHAAWLATCLRGYPIRQDIPCYNAGERSCVQKPLAKTIKQTR